MKKSFLQVLAVIRAIISFCASPKAAAIIQTVPGFKTSVTDLDLLERKITDLMDDYEADLKGFTKHRRELRTTLATVSYPFLKRGMAFARKTNRPGLYSSLNYSFSKLNAMNFNTIAQTMQQCLNSLAVFPIASLNTYGISSLLPWSDCIQQYKNYVSVPRNKVSERKAAGELIETHIKEANEFLSTEVTPQALAFRKSQEAFYLSYKSNLRQIPAPVLHTRLLALLTNELGVPYPACNVSVDTLVKEGRTYKSVMGTSNINGFCTIAEFEPGMRTITVSGEGIETKTFGPFQFNNGKEVIETLMCVPAFTNMPEAKPTEQPKEEI